METTVIIGSAANYATAEEQIYSDAIYKNLNVLMFSTNTEHSDHLKSAVVPGLFMKPNTKSFQHVIHFLLTLLDASEFKKYVHWPCFDRSQETQFRSEVLTYMNFLNGKHQLGLEAMKMHVVVFPGGIKFMKIMLKLSNFIMSEMLRRANANPVTSFNVSSELTAFAAWKNELLGRIRLVNIILGKWKIFDRILYRKLDSKSIELECKTDQLQMTLTQLNTITGHVVDDNLLSTFEADIIRIKNESIVPGLQKLGVIEELCLNLSQVMLTFKENSRRARIHFDQDSIALWQRKCIAHAPLALRPAIENIIQNGRIHRKYLIDIFQFIVPFALTIAQRFQFRSVAELKKESDMVDRLLRQIKLLRLKICKTERAITENIASATARHKSAAASPTMAVSKSTMRLQSNILSTPMMSMYDDVVPSNLANRLPLIAFDLNQTRSQSDRTLLPPTKTPSRIREHMNDSSRAMTVLNTIRQRNRVHNNTLSTSKYVADELMTSQKIVCLARVPFLNLESIANVHGDQLMLDSSPSGHLIHTNPTESPTCGYRLKDTKASNIDFSLSAARDKVPVDDANSALENIAKKIVFSPNQHVADKNSNTSVLYIAEDETIFNISDTVLKDITP